MPTENHPTPITLSARRSQAAAIVAEASGLGLLTAALVVDLVDISTASILGAVGLTTSRSAGPPPPSEKSDDL